MTRTLIERRDKIAKAWLNVVNPLIKPALAADGTLTFENAAITAGAAAGGSYRVTWARFDNNSGNADAGGERGPVHRLEDAVRRRSC